MLERWGRLLEDSAIFSPGLKPLIDHNYGTGHSYAFQIKGYFVRLLNVILDT